jgi:alpha-galactosidase
MIKVSFMGAGSTIFAKNIIGDSMLTESLRDAEFALYDIDATRLEESRMMIENLNGSINENRATISAHLGVENRKAALQGADFVVDAIQVGGYEPSTVIDFEIPKKYGLRQTIADTIGVGGIFRAVRTLAVLEEFARDMEEVSPDAWFLNYTNPMSILSGFMQRFTGVKTVGLCHSVQGCADGLLNSLGLGDRREGCVWKIAGINHMAWLLELRDRDGNDLYPEVKRLAAKKNAAAREEGAEKHGDMVRYEIMRHFGYYNTESSEHTSEYHPYFIKSRCPELIEEFGIPLDEYPLRCRNQIQDWNKQRDALVNDENLTHEKTHEYGSRIMNAIVMDDPIEIGGNVINHGMITNLPDTACVEIPCLVNRNGVQGTYVGALPPQLAALNMTHVNVHELVIQAFVQRRRELLYQAVMMDPHTRAELTLDEIRSLCDDLIEAHGDMMPRLG